MADWEATGFCCPSKQQTPYQLPQDSPYRFIADRLPTQPCAYQTISYLSTDTSTHTRYLLP
jgi:hypothetical protein